MEEGTTCAKGSKVVLIIRGLGGRRHPTFGAGGVPRNSKECLLGVGPRISNGAVGIRARVTPPIRTYRPPSCEEQRKFRRQPPLLPAVREASTVAGPLEGRLCPRLWRDGAPTTPHVAIASAEGHTWLGTIVQVHRFPRIWSPHLVRVGLWTGHVVHAPVAVDLLPRPAQNENAQDPWGGVLIDRACHTLPSKSLGVARHACVGTAQQACKAKHC